MITIGTLFPVVTFGAADEDVIRVLPCDNTNAPKQAKSLKTPTTTPLTDKNAKPAATPNKEATKETAPAAKAESPKKASV